MGAIHGTEVQMDIATARIELMGELTAGLVVFAEAEAERLEAGSHPPRARSGSRRPERWPIDSPAANSDGPLAEGETTQRRTFRPGSLKECFAGPTLLLIPHPPPLGDRP